MYIQKQGLLTVIVFFATLQCFCQCKTSYDEFKQDSIVYTVMEKIGKCKSKSMLSPPTFLEFYIKCVGNKCVLVFECEFLQTLTIAEGQECGLLFSRKTVQSLLNTKHSISNNSKGKPFVQGSPYTIFYNEILFELASSIVATLLNKDLYKVRIAELEITKPVLLKKALQCIASKYR
jgi:hypothetical protein